jgi:heptosyltransferase-3
MPVDDDILTLLQEKGAQVARESQRAVILQPGAIGDAILTLPLAKFMKDSLELGGIDILGHTEYIGILPGRTCIDGVRSMDLANLHKLFVESETFDLADGDPLINVFADYAWIVTFLGEPNGSFEQNLIFTANCSHSAEVVTLSMKPPEGFSQHLTEFYTQQFLDQIDSSLEREALQPDTVLIRATKADRDTGKELLREAGFDFSKKLVVIHPGSGGLSKCWHLDNFLAIAKEIRSRGTEAVFLLGPAEQDRLGSVRISDIAAVVKCLTDLSLTEVLGLLSCASAFVGNDSGITHLAAGLGVRTFAIFGPTNPDVYGPIGCGVTVVTGPTDGFAKQPSSALQQELLSALLA